MQIANEGTPGCSLSMQAQIKVLFYTVAPDAPCDVGKNPASLFDTWRKWVDAYNPDVVVYLARGETFDQQVGGRWQNIGQAGFDSALVDRYRQAVSVLGSRGASVVLPTTPYYDSGTSPAGTPWPEDAPARVTADNATMRQVATHHADGDRREPGLRVRPQRRGLARPRVLADGGPDQCALHRRRALHALGRDLRRPAAGAGAGRAGAGPCRRVAGWRVARSSATIDPVMVHEPALPVVRRATADDVTAMAAQMARTFLDDPVTSHIFRNEARREAGLRAYFGTQMKADYLPFGGCYVAEGYAGSAIWAPAGKPMHDGRGAGCSPCCPSCPT